jgi:cyclic pyranopterin phosphate synthase
MNKETELIPEIVKHEGSRANIYSSDKRRCIDYLRISITDRCNLNCLYCNPGGKISFLQKRDILSYEEMAKVIELFAVKGIRKVRLTGGEPLTKKNITSFVGMLKNIKDIDDISMTTNGILLKDMVMDLKEAGLSRINISLDTLKADRFKLITRGENYFDVWDGIKKSMEAGLNPVKLNVVLLKGINDDEILDFAKLSIEFPLVIRFIELFPINFQLKKFLDSIINNEVVKQKIIKDFGGLKPISDVMGNGPAVYYKIKNSVGIVGFISSFSGDFCDECNRIRIDSTGRVFPCLFSKQIYDIKKLLRSIATDEEIFKFIDEIFKAKPLYRKRNIENHKIEMSSIGG